MLQKLVFFKSHNFLSLHSIYVIGVCLALICGSNAVDFPAPIAKCHFNDEQCLIEQGHKLYATAGNGIPELGIEQLEPLKIERIEILGDQKSPTNLNLINTDMHFYNFSKAVINSIKGFTRDTSKPMKITYVSRNPQVTIKSKYKISGNILILPIRGEGEMTLVLKDITSRIKVFVQPVQRDGKTYLTVRDVKWETRMENIHMDFTNLFNGDKALSENILKVMNENWRLLNQEVSPKIDYAVALKTKDGLNKLFGSVPYEEFFLPDE